jgi:hypothetical protein
VLLAWWPAIARAPLQLLGVHGRLRRPTLLATLRGRAAGGPRTGSVRLAATSILPLGLPQARNASQRQLGAVSLLATLACYACTLERHAAASFLSWPCHFIAEVSQFLRDSPPRRSRVASFHADPSFDRTSSKKLETFTGRHFM